MDADDELKHALAGIATNHMGERDKQALGRVYARAHGLPLSESLTADDVAFLLLVQEKVTRDALRALDRRLAEIGKAQQEILGELRGLRAAPDGYAITLHDVADLVRRSDSSNALRALSAAVEQLARTGAQPQPVTPSDATRIPFSRPKAPDR